MLNEQLIELITRKLAGEASLSEQAALHAHLQEHPEDQYFFEILQQFWVKKNTGISLSERELYDAHFEYIIQQAENDQILENIETDVYVLTAKKAFLFKRIAVAAVVMTLVIAGYLLYKPAKQESQVAGIAPSTEIRARSGTRSKMILPDGSSAWLNSGSKLIYDSNPGDSIREVTLEGEAFFDVVHDARHPFIVHTSGINIRVLGTMFNVKSYEGESTIETTLLRGMIQVENKNVPGSPKVIMRPHEKLIFNKADQRITKSSTDTRHKTAENTVIPPNTMVITTLPRDKPDTALVETAWVYNKLIFDGDSFEELSKKMERWFNVSIHFKNRRAAQCRLHGVFENENIEQALQALQLTSGFKYSINGNEIEIY